MDPAQPITIILDGSNYILWAQAMYSFIKSKKLWRYLIGDVTISVQTAGEPQLKFDKRLDDWYNKNHQIITWFCNTSVLSVYQQFVRYNTAKEIWDLLVQRYTTVDLAHQYQLHDSLHRMKQEPGQSINSFLSQMQRIWDQLKLSEPSWTCSEDSTHFIVYRDHLRLIQLCLKIGAGHFPQECPRNPKKWSKNTSSTSAPPKPGIQHRFKPLSQSAVAADDVLNDSSSSALSVNDAAEVVKQITSNSGTQSSSALSVTSAYDLLSRAGLTDSKTASTPLEPNVRFTPLDGTPLRDPTLHRTLDDSLVYLTVTCPDMAYAVHLSGSLTFSKTSWNRFNRILILQSNRKAMKTTTKAFTS
ncbi:hypothetical protein RJ639_043530 [Escallonia herrerae]|uniref:Retrotransposon Copia-like N-terminal domain-containing protein n=1 Tax=Escallonia herrerae TaxID=1293975 RepID=A0AA88WBA0_9ASTE|nr:hypothetical protein RJ639_043530 [Escallonia herrerae]